MTYFGEEDVMDCGVCDNCNSPISTLELQSGIQEFNGDNIKETFKTLKRN